MKRRKLYLYNPETDNFERFYPTIKDRALSLISIFVIGVLLAVGFYFLMLFLFETPTVENLTAENKELRNNYKQLEKRLDYSMKMVGAIQERDSNLYRVLLQMDPLDIEAINPSVIKMSEAPNMRNTVDSKLVALLFSRMDTLDSQLLHQAISFNLLRDVAIQDRQKLAHTPLVLPINIKDYTVSSGFGTRIDPVYDTPKFHEGLDIAADMGTEIYATADGVIDFAGEKNGYGNCIDIDHGNDYKTRYGHLSKILVKNGERVKRGTLIGLVGSTGKSTGPHLHYEVHFKGEPQNPVNYFFLDITPGQYDAMIKKAESAGRSMD